MVARVRVLAVKLMYSSQRRVLVLVQELERVHVREFVSVSVSVPVPELAPSHVFSLVVSVAVSSATVAAVAHVVACEAHVAV